MLRNFVSGFLFGALMILVGLAGCSSDDLTATELTVGTATSETIAANETKAYQFTAGATDNYTVNMTSFSGDLFDDFDFEFTSGSGHFCTSSLLGFEMSCTLDGVKQNAVNQVRISNVSDAEITFTLVVENL